MSILFTKDIDIVYDQFKFNFHYCKYSDGSYLFQVRKTWKPFKPVIEGHYETSQTERTDSYLIAVAHAF